MSISITILGAADEFSRRGPPSNKRLDRRWDVATRRLNIKEPIEHQMDEKQRVEPEDSPGRMMKLVK